MQIVIDISEENYRSCQTSEYVRKVIYCDLVSAIRRGTILPKGHGRLIDADDLMKRVYRIDDSLSLSSRDVVNEEDIDDAPTIIEEEK